MTAPSPTSLDEAYDRATNYSDEDYEQDAATGVELVAALDATLQAKRLVHEQRLARVLKQAFPSPASGINGGPSSTVRLERVTKYNGIAIEFVLSPRALKDRKALEATVFNEWGGSALVRETISDVDDGHGSLVSSATLSVIVFVGSLQRRAPRSCLSWLRLTGWSALLVLLLTLLYWTVIPLPQQAGTGGNSPPAPGPSTPVVPVLPAAPKWQEVGAPGESYRHVPRRQGK